MRNYYFSLAERKIGTFDKCKSNRVYSANLKIVAIEVICSCIKIYGS